MNAVLAGPPSTIVHSPYLGSISAGGLATITVSAVLSGVRNLSQNMPTGCAPITLVRTTTERQAIWPMSPAADPQPARGFDFYDATVGAQLGFEGVSATGWSYRTGRGVRWRNMVPA